MKVLVANHTPIDGSGSGTYSWTLASGLARRGHDVALLTPPGGPRFTKFGIRHFIARELTINFPSFTGHPLSPRLYSQLQPEDLRNLTDTWERSIAVVLERWSPTVIHAQHLWILTKAALNLHPTVVATCHGSELPFLDGEHAGIPHFRSGHRLAAVIFVSRYILRLANRHLSADTPQIVLPNPFDPSHFTYLPPPGNRRRPRIGFIGRLVEYKRADRFLELTRMLADQIPHLEAWVVGDGLDRPALEDLSRALKLTECTHFLGFQPYEAMPAIYRSLDLVILCSPVEPFGLAALEAAACGTPVYVPHDGGLGELVTDPYIYGYSLNELEPVAEAITALLADGEPESRRAQRSLYMEKRYSLSTYLDQLESIYFRATNDS